MKNFKPPTREYLLKEIEARQKMVAELLESIEELRRDAAKYYFSDNGFA